ncbi:hypothetical protein RCL1_002451 [Eukaryota sp. TZLM3-RCL]
MSYQVSYAQTYAPVAYGMQQPLVSQKKRSNSGCCVGCCAGFCCCCVVVLLIAVFTAAGLGFWYFLNICDHTSNLKTIEHNQSFDYSANMKITVFATQGSVEVAASPDDRLHVFVKEETDGLLNSTDISLVGNDLLVSVNENVLQWFRCHQYTIIVYIPSAAVDEVSIALGKTKKGCSAGVLVSRPLSLRKGDLVTGTGGIQVNDVEFDSSFVVTSGVGKVSIDSIRGKGVDSELTLTSGTGKIEISSLSSTNAELTSGTGAVYVTVAEFWTGTFEITGRSIETFGSRVSVTDKKSREVKGFVGSESPYEVAVTSGTGKVVFKAL